MFKLSNCPDSRGVCLDAGGGAFYLVLQRLLGGSGEGQLRAHLRAAGRGHGLWGAPDHGPRRCALSGVLQCVPVPCPQCKGVAECRLRNGRHRRWHTASSAAQLDRSCYCCAVSETCYQQHNVVLAIILHRHTCAQRCHRNDHIGVIHLLSRSAEAVHLPESHCRQSGAAAAGRNCSAVYPTGIFPKRFFCPKH